MPPDCPTCEPRTAPFFWYIECIAMVIFTLEYLARLLTVHSMNQDVGSVVKRLPEKAKIAIEKNRNKLMRVSNASSVVPRIPSGNKLRPDHPPHTSLAITVTYMMLPLNVSDFESTHESINIDDRHRLWISWRFYPFTSSCS